MVRSSISARWWGLVLLALIPYRQAQASVELYGRITAQDTGFGLEAANVRLYSPTNSGAILYETRTDGFGFYRLQDVPAGPYQFEAGHPAYYSHTTNGLVLNEGQRKEHSAELVPIHPGETPFDVYVQVACAMTGLQLRDVPVQILVRPLDGSPEQDLRLWTDSMGFCQFPGMPKGWYTFVVNSGDNPIPGWDSCVTNVSHDIRSTEWADVLLKPVERSLMVTVYGYDPVAQKENAPLGGIFVELTGVDPWDHQREILPTQVGVSGIRKANQDYWNNDMAGKVKFTGLPPIHYYVEGKRLGYEVGRVEIVTDNQAQLDPNDIRLDMVLLNTVLTVVFNSPYNDPEMLNGLKVRLQGLKNTNTEGIDREGTINYAANENRATAVFTKILPGTYRLSANGRVQKIVPVMVQGQDIYASSWQGPKKFSVRFQGEDMVEAIDDVNHEVEVELVPQPMTLRAQLVVVDEEKSGVLYEYLHYTKPHDGIEFRASEYYQDHMPPNTHLQVVNSDAKGEFVITLLPGLYGVCITNLDEYWGDAVDLLDIQSGDREFVGWPYYQLWPYSAQSAKDLFNYNVGGMAVSSGEELQAQFFVRRDHFVLDYQVSPPDHPARSQLIAFDRDTNGWHSVVTGFTDLEDGLVVTLNGPQGGTENSLSGKFQHLTSGKYTLTATHPRYTFKSITFDYYDFNPPGYLPATEPPQYVGLPHLPEAPHPYPLLPFSLDITGEYNNSGTTKITILQWIQNEEEPGYYEEMETERRPDFIQIDAFSNRIFSYNYEPGYDDLFKETPPTPYAVWVDLGKYFEDEGEHWFYLTSAGGNLESTIKIGGPLATPQASSTPFTETSYELLVEALNGNKPEERVDGVSVRFDDGTQAVSGGPALTGRKKGVNFQSNQVRHSNWNYTGNSRLGIVPNTGNRVVLKLTLFMSQGVAIRGKVTNARTGSPIPNTHVNVLRAQGSTPIMGTPSRDDGTFSYGYAYGRQVYFIEVQAKGYAPYRQRLDPDRDAVPDSADPRTLAYLLEGTNEIKLVPLAQPTILTNSVSLNRFGAFLPGFSKAGNQMVFNAFSAAKELTMTWKLQAISPSNQVVILPRFDDAEGHPQGSTNVSLVDAIKEIWLVDLRAFPTNAFDDEPIALQIPETIEPHRVHDWLEQIRTAEEPSYRNVYQQQMVRFSPTASTNTVESLGEVKLWELPPGQFKPAFVVVSRLGAVAAYPFKYEGAYTNKELYGIRVPSWMGMVSDLLSLVANTQPTRDERFKKLAKVTPKGRFRFMPAFSSEVILRADGFLEYFWKVDINCVEGMESPSSDYLGLAPGTLGFNLYGGLKIEFKGADRAFRILGKIGIEANSINPDGHTPSFFKKMKPKIEFDPKPSGEWSIMDTFVFDPQFYPQELKVLHGVSGQVGLKTSVSLMPVLKYIPKVGQVLLFLNKTMDLDIKAVIKGMTGLRSKTEWKTVFPSQVEHSYLIQKPEQRQLLRHLLGGYESGGTKSFDLCFNFGVGLGAEAFKSRADVTGTIELAGDDCWTRNPALLIDFNPLGDWPVIKRVRGDGRAVVTVKIIAWDRVMQKKWYWKGLTIDHQFGTETVFKLTDMDVAVWETKINQFPPSTFNGTTPQLIQDFLPIGSYDVAAHSTDALIFTDMLGLGGDMGLKVSFRTGSNSWSAPKLIGQTDGVILDAQILQSPEGSGWMAVWSAIDKKYMGDFNPPSALRYSTADAQGINWSAPVVLASLSDVAAHLRLVRFGPQLGLIFMETDEGPTPRHYVLMGATWNGSAWSVPQQLLGSTPITGFDVAGSPDVTQLPVHVAFVDETEKLSVLSWNGTNAATPELLAEGAGNDISLVLGTHLSHHLAWNPTTNGIGLFQFDPAGAGWTNQGTIYSNAQPTELQIVLLEDTAEPALIIAWTEGADVSGLWYGFASLSGQPLAPATPLTLNANGRYFRPKILPGPQHKAALLARFKHDPIEELCLFNVALPPGQAVNERDGDGLDDLKELWIVDADPQDAYRTIDDVRPDDDFDHDGFSNRQELAFDSLPSNPASYPSLQVIIEPESARQAGAQWRVAGGPWQDSGTALALPVGQHLVEFKEISGWPPPANQTVTIDAGQTKTIICTFTQGKTFDDWIAAQAPEIPADKRRPDDRNGPLALPNLVAYALGLNPMTAVPSDLPWATRDGNDLVYTYYRAKGAAGVSYRVQSAGNLISNGWSELGPGDHFKTGETGELEVWQATLPMLPDRSQGFLILEIIKQP